MECERGGRGEGPEGTYCNESTICTLGLFSFCSCLIAADTFDIVKSIGMIRLVVGDIEFAHRACSARRSPAMSIASSSRVPTRHIDTSHIHTYSLHHPSCA
jgi:hypothetical protein